MKHTLRGYFITGLFVFIPIFVTVYVIWLSFLFLDSLLRPLVNLVLPGEVPGLSLSITLLIIMALGAVVTLAAGKKVLEFFEEILSRVPIISGIYSATKEASSLFLMQGKGEFKSVVLVEYPRKGIYSLGFTAGVGHQALSDKTGERMVNVFVPTTPNPTTGNFIMVPAKEVIEAKMTIDEAAKLLLSGGLMEPKKKDKNRQ